MTIGTANGLSLSTQILSLGLASSIANGALDSVDWTTFNAKQAALNGTGFVKISGTTISYDNSTYLTTASASSIYQTIITNPVTGSGTVNYVPKFNTTSSIANSNIQDSGTLITLGSNTYVNGSLGIGTNSLTNIVVNAGKTFTGSSIGIGYNLSSTINSDVTVAATGYQTSFSTQAATFTLNELRHFQATQGTIGAGSTVTSQFGYWVSNQLIGAINNYGFYGQIPFGNNRWNLYMQGTAWNYLAGALGIGSVSLTGYNLRVGKTITGATSAYGIASDSTIQSDVTSQVLYNYVLSSTVAASFTLNNLYYYSATQGTFGAGSSVSTQTGFNVQSTLIGAGTNYGFRGQINAQTNAWNIYMDGTALNYLAGSLGIGTTSLTGYNLRINKNITGATISHGILSEGAVQSDVTDSAYYNRTVGSTVASSFTILNLHHYNASQGTFGAGSTVNSQYGFRVNSSLIGATNNFAFFGDIPSGTNRWNIYMDGTANNYLAGDTSIGTTTLGTATKLTIGGSETAVSAIARGQLINPTLVASANGDNLVGLIN